ncbi:11157_t:CDS:2 [Paraglomus brasilianum]|uniref:11157_t:CDS:1 n=1 Tax=Paraglomus brasilianum TaxID=144538 RepID=A0A9N8VKY5_9GLOM|nr:11157_t:CDS:2 [Paraglomus brasilianum]
MDSMGYNQEQMVENGRLYAAGDQMSRVKVEQPMQLVDHSHHPPLLRRDDHSQVVVPQHSTNHGSPPSTTAKTTYTCKHCGKKYKHRNCLVKHLWEHHESWELCLKFNLTKHQQVQMMEAAQILVDLACIKQH